MWEAITPVIITGIVSLFLAWRYSARQKRQLIAEEISKSRVEWLKITRGYVSDYMSEANQCWYLMHSRQTLQNKIDNLNISVETTAKKDNNERIKLDNQKDKLEKLNGEIVNSKFKAEEKYYKCMYSINPTENIKIFLDNYLRITQETLFKNINSAEKNELTRIIAEEVQRYFKSEWEKAKGEIETGEIDKTPHQKAEFVIFDEAVKMADSGRATYDDFEKAYINKNDARILKQLPKELISFVKTYPQMGNEFALIKEIALIESSRRGLNIYSGIDFKGKLGNFKD